MKKLPVVGQRVVAKKSLNGLMETKAKGQAGTVIQVERGFFDNGLEVLVEFDNRFSDFLHDAQERVPSKKGYWVCKLDIKLEK